MLDSTRQILPNQHTPGPWRAFGYEIVGKDNERIALTSTPNRPHPEERANARLIAAAPEMYEVLKDLLTGFYTSPRGEFDERIHAVLAKAEGRAVAMLAQVVEDQQA